MAGNPLSPTSHPGVKYFHGRNPANRHGNERRPRRGPHESGRRRTPSNFLAEEVPPGREAARQDRHRPRLQGLIARNEALFLSAILLDTQAYLWFLAGDLRLSPRAQESIELNPRVLLSTASLWEIAIKHSFGKLSLPDPLEVLVAEMTTVDQIELCTIETRHILQLASLPFHHRDPFDRMLIAQALIEDLSIVSTDEQFDAYGVTRVW